MRIEGTPSQGEVAGIVVEKALVAESGMIRIRLIENVSVAARSALDDGRFEICALSHDCMIFG